MGRLLDSDAVKKALCDAVDDISRGFTAVYGIEEDDIEGIIDSVPSVQPEIIRCKDCKHKPYPSDNYDYDNGDCGFEIIFPDYRCPCRCDDEYYNRIPDDDWFCGYAERRTDEPEK